MREKSDAREVCRRILYSRHYYFWVKYPFLNQVSDKLMTADDLEFGMMFGGCFETLTASEKAFGFTFVTTLLQ